MGKSHCLLYKAKSIRRSYLPLLIGSMEYDPFLYVVPLVIVSGVPTVLVSTMAGGPFSSGPSQ
jgi:hypothetical protein